MEIIWFGGLGLSLGLVLGFFLALGFIVLMTIRSVHGSTVHVNRSGANGTDIVITIFA